MMDARMRSLAGKGILYRDIMTGWSAGKPACRGVVWLASWQWSRSLFCVRMARQGPSQDEGTQKGMA